MDVRFLSAHEFDKVYFYCWITGAVLLAIVVLILSRIGQEPVRDLLLVSGLVSPLVVRFVIELRRLLRSGPAFIHQDQLFIVKGDSRRQVALSSIHSAKSSHSIFMVRRYRSWSDHIAFLEITLANGQRVGTLVDSAMFESPAGKESLAGLRAAVSAARAASAAARTAAA